MIADCNPQWLLVLGALITPAPWPRQEETLEAVAQAARQAWLAHDVHALVGRSTTVVLQIPGADPSAPLGRAQAAELLRRYLAGTTEDAVTIVTVREVEEGRGFVELERRYMVRGTTDARRETVFLGFRQAGTRWVLSEVRSAGATGPQGLRQLEVPSIVHGSTGTEALEEP